MTARRPRTVLLLAANGRRETWAIPCDALVADGPGGRTWRPCRADAVMRVAGERANLCRAHALRASAVTLAR